jgi:uncharacterized protein YbaA (DUF1428 family)
MPYVDGFVLAVPAASKDAFRAHAEKAAVLFRKHGALKVVECWGDDLPEGRVNSFHTAVLRKEGETVCFSWILWPDRATRDAGNPKVFADMSAEGADMTEMPFDGSRMIFGGFEMIVEA